MRGLPEWVVAPWYWANIRTWATALVHLNARVQVQGAENIPRHGPLIIASNHISLADPPIITVVVPRRIVWMAKRELFGMPGLGLAFYLFGCLPVRRFEADLAALRQARRVLERGLALGMFPEGTRSGRPGMNRAWPGTALLALQTGAPVLPVGIMGTEQIHLPRDIVGFLRLRRYPVRVVVGQPFRLPVSERLRSQDVQEGTEAIMARIAALLDPPYRGVYARVVAEASEGKE